MFSKEQLYEAVFGFDAEGDPGTIAEHIKNIRAKLKKYGKSPIETVWGMGYKWKKETYVKSFFCVTPICGGNVCYDAVVFYDLVTCDVSS